MFSPLFFFTCLVWICLLAGSEILFPVHHDYHYAVGKTFIFTVCTSMYGFKTLSSKRKPSMNIIVQVTVRQRKCVSKPNLQHVPEVHIFDQNFSFLWAGWQLWDKCYYIFLNSYIWGDYLVCGYQCKMSRKESFNNLQFLLKVCILTTNKRALIC